MQVIEQLKIEIDQTILSEVEKAAEFEQKSLEDYVNSALRVALKRTENTRLLPEKIRKHQESYEKFPQELDDSDEEFEHWQKVYGKWEQDKK